MATNNKILTNGSSQSFDNQETDTQILSTYQQSKAFSFSSMFGGFPDVIHEENEDTTDHMQINISSTDCENKSSSDNYIVKEIMKLGITAQIENVKPRERDIEDKSNKQKYDKLSSNKKSVPKISSLNNLNQLRTDCVEETIYESYEAQLMNNSSRRCAREFESSALIENNINYMRRRSSFNDIAQTLSYNKEKDDTIETNKIRQYKKNNVRTHHRCLSNGNVNGKFVYNKPTLNTSSSDIGLDVADLKNTNQNVADINNQLGSILSERLQVSSIPNNSTTSSSLEITRKATNSRELTFGRDKVPDSFNLSMENKDTSLHKTDNIGMKISSIAPKSINIVNNNSFTDASPEGSDCGNLIGSNTKEQGDSLSKIVIQSASRWATSQKIKQNKRERQMLTPMY